MREIRIEKIVLNVGCGTSGNIENAKRVLEDVAGAKAVITKTTRRTTFNVPKNKDIGCKVTIRKDVDKMLTRLLEAKDNKLKAENFDSTGNFAFGVQEYIDVPGAIYDPKIGIIGFDVAVRLERPGYSVIRKKLKARMGKRHRIKKEEAMDFVKNKFNVQIE